MVGDKYKTSSEDENLKGLTSPPSEELLEDTVPRFYAEPDGKGRCRDHLNHLSKTTRPSNKH